MAMAELEYYLPLSTLMLLPLRSPRIFSIFDDAEVVADNQLTIESRTYALTWKRTAIAVPMIVVDEMAHYLLVRVMVLQLEVDPG